MNQKNKTLFWILIALLIMNITINRPNNTQVLEKKEIPMTLIINNTHIIGFDVNTTTLTFGQIPPNLSSRREITISNEYNAPVNIEIRKKGEIKNFITPSETIFTLEKTQSKKIIIYAYSQEAQNKKYEGTLEIIIKK